MKKAVLMGVLGAACVIGGLTLPACSWFSANKGQVAADVGQIGACIVNQALNSSGPIDPGAIAASCVGATAADVIAIVESLINFYSSNDGGVAPTPAVMARLQTIKAAKK